MSTPYTEDELVHILSSPNFFGESASSFKHISTHAHHIFLAGNFAYKMKRHVNLGFLDYSTLEKRKTFVEKEFDLNHRFAPELYLNVVSLNLSTSGALSILEAGEPVEYLLKMVRFDESFLYSNLLDSGHLTDEHINKLIPTIFNYHNKAEYSPEYWSFEIVSRFIIENIDAILKYTKSSIHEEVAKELLYLSKKSLENNKDLITKRQKTHVKKLHGDLHLRNIVLFNGDPLLFDGLEFDEEYYCTDLLADFAFLLMDLSCRGRDDLANRSLNLYLENSDDYAGLPLLSLYISYRAAVRAKVAFVSSLSIEEEKDRYAREAVEYLTYSTSILRDRSPQLIAVGGISGSGKSTISCNLAPKISAIVVRSDVVRKHLLGVTPNEKAPLEAYSDDVSDRTYNGMIDRAGHALTGGFSTICDATFLNSRHREMLSQLSRSLKVKFFAIWCVISHEIAAKRVVNRLSDASDATSETVRAQVAKYSGTPTGWIELNTEQPLPNILKELLSQMGK